ncbi:hypothetical protein Poli38472_003007 [Pythium oligandrum]|uniref:Serine/threonine-protein phosphatase n=1 Tax=Pythium oligandrum TaxID=41045 RepID=A0A8K1C5U9_PYTOL|nr:hypothetical protein Poli38472_003007 [Pythium oligandrum]|eukprot:TMW57082.1 hypothetical protein Poli38472_003007 [Pythium oligandrum]
MNMRRNTHVTLSLDEMAALFRQQTPLAVKDALKIIHEAQDVMNDEPNVVSVCGAAIHVFGDIHGQFFDLLALIESVGVQNLAENDIKLLFLGDYVDRGAFSCEVMLYLLLLKTRFPKKVFLLRGNHECETISSFYGFRTECRVKYGISAYYHFLSCFQSMPIAALIKTPRGDIFCVHGGLSPDILNVHDVESIDRRREVPIEGPLCDLLWSDPSISHQDGVNSDPAWTTNKVRGCSYYFNAAALFQFLARNRLLCVIRAHEYEDAGYMYHFDSEEYKALDQRADKSTPPLITVFSAPNYCDTHGNKAGRLVIHSDPFRLETSQLETHGHPIPTLLSVERTRIRRETSEMHPQAIRKALDDEATKWMQTDDNGDIKIFSAKLAGSPSDVLSASSDLQERIHLRHHKKGLTPQEVEMMKLCFSLMDTDGSTTLNVPEVSHFVFNILGERISDDMAARYLQALDYDNNGVVDFGDILSWASVMKAHYEEQNASPLSLKSLMVASTTILDRIDPYRGLLWLSLVYVVRSLYYWKGRAQRPSRSLRVFQAVAVILYGLDLLRTTKKLGISRWIDLSVVWTKLGRK